MNNGSVTFPVHDVAPSTELLEECAAADALAQIADGPVEACSNGSDRVVKYVEYNPFVYAVHLAYADHRPLELTPDMVWMTIAQGIALHINLHTEELRPNLVDHLGKKELKLKYDGTLAGSPFFDWPLLADEFNSLIRTNVDKSVFDLLTAEFSTTGRQERTAFAINTMSAFRHYFDYIVYLICGIPKITLRGTVEDWQLIHARVSRMDQIGLNWWKLRLEPVCEQFVQAAGNNIDTAFWESIYKVEKQYGGELITGWIINFFPYLQDMFGEPSVRNPLLSKGGRDCPAGGSSDFPVELLADPADVGDGRKTSFNQAGLRLDQFPSGLSAAPVTFVDENGDAKFMQLIGGFTGIRQDHLTGTLKPVVGWGVTESDGLEELLKELKERHRTFRPDVPKSNRGLVDPFPGELLRIYQSTNGAEIIGDDGKATFRLLPLDKIAHVIDRRSVGKNENTYGMEYWVRFADFSDQSHLAYTHKDRGSWDIIHYMDSALEQPEYCPVIARTFMELLACLLAKDKRDLPDYGNGQEYHNHAATHSGKGNDVV